MTHYSVPLEDGGDPLELRMSIWTGAHLVYHGQRLRRSGLMPVFRLQDAQDRERTITLRSRFFDSLPRVLVDGKEVEYVEPLPWWGTMITATGPILVLVSLFGIGDLAGATLGLVAYYLGQNAIRSAENPASGAMVAAGLAVLAWGGWLFAVLAAFTLAGTQ